MKKIKRTTIKIRQREIIVVRRGGETEAETIEKCPTCQMPIQINLRIEDKKPQQISESNED